MCGLPFVGVNILAGGYFQAHGRPILALMLTLLRQLLFLLPCLYFLPRVFERCGSVGLNGCWFSFPISDALAFAIAAGFLVAEYRTKKKEIAEFQRRKAEEAAQTSEAATGA
jgi:Na+-driven multidrug efflux pump